MNEHDMSGVDPLRWDEVRRRIAVVKSYLSLTNATDADRSDHATRLGLSANQFMALVRSWREHRSAAKVAGSGAHRRATRRPSRLSIPKEAKDAAAAAIEELGPTAPLVDINAEVDRRCAKLQLAPPSRSSIWNMVMAKRQECLAGESGVVVGTAWVRLPLKTETGIVFPTITMAVRGSDGAVIAAAMPATYVDWAGLVRSIEGSAEIRIDDSMLSPFGDDGKSIVPIAGTAARTSLARIIGRGLDDVPLIYQVSRAVLPESLLRTKDDHPLAEADARSIVIAAVERHNAKRRCEDAVWITGPAIRRDGEVPR